MTQPTRQEIIDAHKALEYLIKNLYDLPLEEAKHTTSYERLAKFLPPRPQTTMAEIEWDDDKHYLAEAMHPEHNEVLMLVKHCFSGNIGFLYKDEDGYNDILYTAPENLTPTGKRYTLTEVQE